MVFQTTAPVTVNDSNSFIEASEFIARMFMLYIYSGSNVLQTFPEYWQDDALPHTFIIRLYYFLKLEKDETKK
jgi:hypothetical protein